MSTKQSTSNQQPQYQPTSSTEEKLIKVLFNEEIEICSLGILPSLKLDQTTINMLKEYTTLELNERLNLYEKERLNDNDYQLKLSNSECETVKELYEKNGFLCVIPNSDVKKITSRQNLIESLIELNSDLEAKMNGLKEELERNKQQNLSKSKTKYLLVEIEKINLKFENYKIETDFKLKNELKKLYELDELKQKLDTYKKECKQEIDKLKYENKHLIDLLQNFNEAIFKTDYFIENFNKRNLIEQFIKKCSHDLKIDHCQLELKNIDFDKYKLKREDLSCLLMYNNNFKKPNNQGLAREIALSIVSTPLNKDGWRRIFKATFGTAPEQVLFEDETLSF